MNNVQAAAFRCLKLKAVFICCVFFSYFGHANDVEMLNNLRAVYSQPQQLWPKAHVIEGNEVVEIGQLAPVPFPEHNPFSREKLILGEKLFHDGQLSRSGQIACASCHDADLGWADGRKTSFGHNRAQGRRNAPSIENVAYNQHFFWDGRAKSLEQQALMPIQDKVEMNFTLAELEQRLSKSDEYRQGFKSAFGDDNISAERIGQALATYQRTIVSRISDFDRFLMAPEQTRPRVKKSYLNAMSDQAIWGMHLFRTKAMCINCHYGPTFTDQKFHNLGLTFYKRKYQDLGQYQHSTKPEDVGKFKTPGLRGVMNTGPWMHNGLFPDIVGILNFYNAGGIRFEKQADDPLSPATTPMLKPLLLTREEILALQAFLMSITAPPAVGPAGEFLVNKNSRVSNKD